MKLVEVNNNFLDGLFKDYWEPFIGDMPNAEYLTGFDMDFEVWEYLMYFTYNPITRYVYNREYQPKRIFEKNMDRAIEKYCVGIREKSIQGMRKKVQDISKNLNSSKITKNGLTYHVEFLWISENSKTTCDICSSNNGKQIQDVKNLYPHFGCRCVIEKHEWWTNNNGEKVKENIKIL